MIDINIIIPVGLGGTLLGGGVVAYCFTHPEVIEKILSYFFKAIKYLFKCADKQYVKYNIQSNINNYICKLNKKVPNLDAQQVKVEWIDENITPEQFLKSGALVLRMHRSSNQNKNIVNATYTYVSSEVIKKAKTYLAPYQKEAIDLFVSYRALEKAGHDIMDAFVQNYLRTGLQKDAVDALYAKFDKIYTSGLFFPVFITEMTFLGEKIFGKGVNKNLIYKEVNDLVSFLLSLSARHTGEESCMEHQGEYSKFAIRIVGKQAKIENKGKGLYVRNIKPLVGNHDTLYLLGNANNKTFIDEVAKEVEEDDNIEIYHKITTQAHLRNSEGEEFDVNNYVVILRKKTVEIIRRH